MPDDESDEAVRVIADWLLSHGVPKRIALRAAADEDFRECISRELQIGIEQLITAWGARQLGDDLWLDLDDDVGGIELVP